MDVLFYILVSTFLVSLIAFVGILVLFLKEELLNKILLILVAFSAGALIGGAFLHLIPEAVAKVEANQIFNLFLYLIFGFCIFFILENFIRWHHHHAKEHPEIMPFSYLILVSDGIHNFIDGESIIFLLPFAAGTFIYIASSDLLPEIKHKESLKKSLIHFFVFLLGIILMLLIKLV